MAVDTETVQETDAATEQAAADSTTQTTEQDAAAIAEPQTETAAPAAETTQTATAEVASGIPAWDPDKQRRDQEAADKRKALIRKEVAEQVAEALAKTGITPAQQQQAIDDGADIQKLLDDAERLSDEATKKAEDDPYESAKLSAAASKASVQANRKLLELNKRDAATRKARDDEEAKKATVSAEWQAFQKANPSVPIQKAQELADDCYKLAADAGYEGKNHYTRANELFQQKLSDLKKSSTPAPKPPQQSRQTAPPTSASAPAGTQVIPANTGARKDATQLSDVAKRFAAHFRKQS